MLDPIEITMEAVKTFSDPHYDNSAKSLFLYPEILAPILANVVPEYQGMRAEQVMEYIINSNFAYRFYLCTLKIQYLAGIRLSKFYPLPYAA